MRVNLFSPLCTVAPTIYQDRVCASLSGCNSWQFQASEPTEYSGTTEVMFSQFFIACMHQSVIRHSININDDLLYQVN